MQGGSGPSPTPEALFHFCLPLDRVEAPVQVRKTGPRSYMFWSASRDFRYQETELLRAEQIGGYEPFGALGGMVGVMVGFGSNFLNVIQSDDRLLLHNGHHRVCALRELGITHAPCIVQSVTRLDELRLVAARVGSGRSGFLFPGQAAAAPEGFFRSPKIRKIVPVRSMANVIEVSIEIKELKKDEGLRRHGLKPRSPWSHHRLARSRYPRPRASPIAMAGDQP